MRKGFFLGFILYLVLIVALAWQTTPRQGSLALYLVYNAQEEQLMNLPLEEYVACVVAAEMPASYELEALKAQAVAARTRALNGSCAQHPEALVCTSSACCQAYLDEAAQRARWGQDYDFYAAKIAQAAQETAGQWILYQDEPILVLYHAVSGGHTEDVELVYSQALPYLRGVESAGEEHASRYENTQRFDRTSFAEAINQAYPKAQLQADRLENQLEILARSDSGRVLGLRLGNIHIDGRDLRKTLGLYSTNFTLSFAQDEIILHQLGYGHGVGMSQAGAQAMALAGSTHEEILTHYYTGIQIAHSNQDFRPD